LSHCFTNLFLLLLLLLLPPVGFPHLGWSFGMVEEEKSDGSSVADKERFTSEASREGTRSSLRLPHTGRRRRRRRRR